MLERLRVLNFRGLEDLQVDGLGRINLVAGRNDIGKSTLLEAVCLLGSGANPQLPVKPYLVRSGDGEITGVGVFERADDGYPAFPAIVLKPGHGDVKRDAVYLGRLRKQERGDLVKALQVVDSRLQGIEGKASSGEPMIWVDVGLPERLPLPVMGQGLKHVARLVLNASAVRNGVLLVDEIENGLHHSVLRDLWRVVRQVAEQFNVQVFATTHSFECVQAAHDALGADGFSLHRLEAANGTTRCVTYNDDAIAGAMLHNMEIR